MSTADGYVLPKPGVPKTLGILSTIFAVGMILYGICMTGYMAMVPAIMQASTQVLKTVQEKAEADHKAQLKSIEDQEKAATTDEQKATLKQQRDLIEATPVAKPPDMAALTSMATNPTVMTVTYTTLFTGLILAILLLVAGINLIRLTPTGRSLSIWWAGLQIAQILALVIVNLIFILPLQQEMQKKLFADMDAQAKAQGGPNNPGLAGLQMAQAMSGAGGIMVVFSAIVGCIYPTIVLILLNTAGARAACLPKKPTGMGIDGF